MRCGNTQSDGPGVGDVDNTIQISGDGKTVDLRYGSASIKRRTLIGSVECSTVLILGESMLTVDNLGANVGDLRQLDD